MTDTADTKTRSPNWGGKRPNSGRRTEDDVKLVGRVYVGLDAESLAILDTFEGSDYGVKVRALCKAYSPRVKMKLISKPPAKVSGLRRIKNIEEDEAPRGRPLFAGRPR